MASGSNRATSLVTMKDVAARAGVSYKTVSNVVNGRNGQMRPETMERVRAAMDELGFRPNHAAQTLKRGRTDVMGLAMGGFEQPFMGYFADCLARCARERGRDLSIALFEESDEGLAHFLDRAPRLDVDGWVVFTSRPVPPSHPLFHQPFPCVLVGDYSAHGLIDSVAIPNVAAAREATAFLLDRCGGNGVAFIGAPLDVAGRPMTIGPSEVPEGNAAQRYAGYMSALAERGIDVDERLVGRTPWMVTSLGQRAMGDILAAVSAGEIPMPGGVVCGNDALAIGALSALFAAGVEVPGDMQVIGFDNLPDGRFTTPPLSTLDPHAEQYAALAVDDLLRRIDGDDGPARVLHPGFELVRRGTTKG